MHILLLHLWAVRNAAEELTAHCRLGRRTQGSKNQVLVLAKH